MPHEYLSQLRLKNRKIVKNTRDGLGIPTSVLLTDNGVNGKKVILINLSISAKNGFVMKLVPSTTNITTTEKVRAG